MPCPRSRGHVAFRYEAELWNCGFPHFPNCLRVAFLLGFTWMRGWGKRSFKMSTAFDSVAFDRATDPIFGFFTVDQAKALIAYRGDEPLRDRIEQLATRSTEGTLTESERAEYEGYVRANKFIATLQAKARKLLDK
jgi:hypothetical protein